MKILDVIYFNLYSYNIKFLNENEPHAKTGFILSLCESFIIISFLSFTLARFFDIYFYKTKWYGVIIFILLIIFNYLFYQRSGRSRKIVKLKPVIINRTISTIITISFCIFSFLIFGLSATWLRNFFH